MTLHPAIQTKGQQEIDNVIGNDRLPKLANRDALPYVEAIVKEVFRWNPVLPIGLSSFRSTCYMGLSGVTNLVGFPHSAIEDDVYKGFFIPKNSMILVNAWFVSGLLH